MDRGLSSGGGGEGRNYYVVVNIYFYLIFTTFMYNTSYINITFN